MATTRSQSLLIKVDPYITESKQKLLLKHTSDSEATDISNGNKEPTTSTYKNPQGITQAQIKKLFDGILKGKMNIAVAARKAGMSPTTGMEYYKVYKDDPEHKIPIPRGAGRKKPFYSENEIKALITCIVQKKMTITAAARTVNMGIYTAAKYYQKYLNDPTKKKFANRSIQIYTQPQINSLLHYITRDKMSVRAASIKANMSYATANTYYKVYQQNKTVPKPRLRKTLSKRRLNVDNIKELIGYIENDGMSIEDASQRICVKPETGKKYFKKYIQNNEIPIPGKRVRPQLNSCTLDQVKNLIRYIEEDNLTLGEASAKCDMTPATAKKYYTKYLLDGNGKVPVPMENIAHRNGRCITDEQVKEFFTYVFIEKQTVIAAALKANISLDTAYNYHSKFMTDIEHKNGTIQNSDFDTIANMTPQERVIKLFEYINVEKMSVAAAARKSHMCVLTARRYYRQKQAHPDREVIVPNTKFYTYEQIKELIRIINTEKITAKDASKRVNMTYKSAQVYYKKYKKDPLRRIPIPAQSKYQLRQQVYQTHYQIILDIYNKSQEIAKQHPYYNWDGSDSTPSRPGCKRKPSVIKASNSDDEYDPDDSDDHI